MTSLDQKGHEILICYYWLMSAQFYKPIARMFRMAWVALNGSHESDRENLNRECLHNSHNAF